ncbi:MAG: hypothetical protein WC905_02735 [Patescibacteria group bacterium]|jgi:hypothetical protein
MTEPKSVEKIAKIALDKFSGQAEDPAKVERPLAPEAKPEIAVQDSVRAERALEKPAKPLEKSGEGQMTAAPSPAGYLQQRAIAIDDILAEGLNDVFLKMPPAAQAEFKKKGEETVVKINGLLSQARVKVNKIIDLIRRWLKLIPGVNRFFLEQEAKIKADKIFKIRDKF